MARQSATTGSTERDLPMKLGRLNDMFGYLLRRAWRDASRTFNTYFAELDLNAAQYAVLILIEGNPGCTPGDLVDPVGVTQNNLVKLIDTLIERGLVAKSVSPHDRRARIIALTPAGNSLLKQAHAIHVRYDEHYREHIAAADIDALTRLLRQFDRGYPHRSL